MAGRRQPKEHRKLMRELNGAIRAHRYASGKRRKAFYFNIEESSRIISALWNHALSPGADGTAALEIVQRISPLTADCIQKQRQGLSEVKA
jgi:hypothetical protein